MSTSPRVIKDPRNGNLHLVCVAFYHGHESLTNIGIASYYCTYAEMWVKVKSVYKLTITSAEKTALTSMLNTC
jgi:hypothetical protein